MSKNEGTSNTNLKPPTLLEELAECGVKYNLDDVLSVIKTSSGKLVWLEKGNAKAGLEHVMSHADDFAAKVINSNDIPDLLMKALSEGEVVGYQGRGKLDRYTKLYSMTKNKESLLLWAIMGLLWVLIQHHYHKEFENE